MNRPPFRRNSSRQKAKALSSKDRGPKTRKLGIVIVAVVAYSFFEYATTGSVQWPDKLLRQTSTSVSDYATRPDAGWRKAADAVDSIGAAREGIQPPGFDIVGRVVRVADGDTISVLDSSNKQHKVRFFGIDAPERDQPHGQSARKALAGMVDNRQVGVVIVETDDYGRTVGTVYQDKTNINHAMVSAGLAWWYRFHAPHERHLEGAEDEARAKRLGLWADNNPIAPWDWRRGRRH